MLNVHQHIQKQMGVDEILVERIFRTEHQLTNASKDKAERLHAFGGIS